MVSKAESEAQEERGEFLVIAKFHYTGPTGPARTLSETRTDQRSFSEIRVGSGPCRRTRPDQVHGLCLVGYGRARLVEFSYYATAFTPTARRGATGREV